MTRIIRNAAKCIKCSDVVESKHRHDFVTCSCGAIFVDGGNEYLRRGGDPDSIEELSEYTDLPLPRGKKMSSSEAIRLFEMLNAPFTRPDTDVSG